MNTNLTASLRRPIVASLTLKLPYNSAPVCSLAACACVTSRVVLAWSAFWRRIRIFARRQSWSHGVKLRRSIQVPGGLGLAGRWYCGCLPVIEVDPRGREAPARGVAAITAAFLVNVESGAVVIRAFASLVGDDAEGEAGALPVNDTVSANVGCGQPHSVLPVSDKA